MEEIPNQDEEIPREGLPILIHIERLEGDPILSNFLQKELIGEIVNGCVQEYPVSINTFNEFECVIAMPKEMVASIVAQDLQNMTQWGGICANIQCTIASHSKFRTITNNREKDQTKIEQEASAPQQVSPQPEIEEMMNKMITGILTTVDEKLKSISDKSFPCVSNQSFATDKVIPSSEIALVMNSQNLLREGGAI